MGVAPGVVVMVVVGVEVMVEVLGVVVMVVAGVEVMVRASVDSGIVVSGISSEQPAMAIIRRSIIDNFTVSMGTLYG